MNHLFEILIQDTNLSITGFLILCGVSLLGSLVAGALGLGGGVLVLATMANLLSPTALVPIHGVVQLGSNPSRAVLSWRQTLMSIVTPFFLGSIIGVALGAGPACWWARLLPLHVRNGTSSSAPTRW